MMHKEIRSSISNYK